MITDYVQTGKVALEYRDFAFGGQESLDAAAASDCALDQGKFWQYHDTVYLNQHGENQGAFTRDRLKQMAKDVGLDTAKFNQCLDSNAHAQDVTKDANAASSAGIPGTPAFLVNDKKITYNGYDSLKAAIEAALAGK